MNEPLFPPEDDRSDELAPGDDRAPLPSEDREPERGADDIDDTDEMDDAEELDEADDIQAILGGGDDDDDDDFDGDDGDADDDDEHEEGDDHRAVFVSTALPVPIHVAPLDDERAPGGSALGAFIGERLVARCAMPREAIDHLMELDLFSEPVALALLAVEEDPGLQCRLFALVPADRIVDEDDETASEPWRASVPSFEESLAAMEEDDEDEDEDDEEDEDDDSAVASILLGHIVRFARDRKFADDLTAEAVDVLQKIVLGGQLEDANSRAVDDLLDSL